MNLSLPIMLATRLDWGFGNPNKTAAFIGFLMVALWTLPSLHRRLFWLALVLCTVLGSCLMQTASRGGIVAAAIALGILLARTPRPWPRAYLVGGMASVWIVLGIAFWLPTMRRFGKAMGGQDLSIVQRLGLWGTAPSMMVDAPGGWGMGNSADVFHQWYQPLGQNQLFASLINSHLTLLAEIGWPLRFLYVFGWLAVLALCWLQGTDIHGHVWLAIPFSLWTSFGITAWFNPVAESNVLWFVPLVGLGSVIMWRWQRWQWPGIREMVLLVLCSGTILGVLLLLGANRGDRPRLRLQGKQVLLGSSAEPVVWLLVDREVLGNSYGHTLRRAWQENWFQDQGIHMSIGLTNTLDDLSPETVRAKTLVVCGTLNEKQLARLKVLLPVCLKLVLLNPTFFPQALNVDRPLSSKIEIVAGEFSQVPVSAWAEILKIPSRTVPGAGNYLPRWPELLLSHHLIIE